MNLQTPSFHLDSPYTQRLGTYLSISAVLILGAFARLYQLGQDNLWNDEAGQVWAAIQPTVREMLDVERSHVMAMPLDYVITRLVANFSLDEAFLRFPSVVWGTMTIFLLYKFLRDQGKYDAALYAAILLSLSATHIRYSQEVRFYAALGFFFMLSTMLLVKAVSQPNYANWGKCLVAASLGIYFHPYVLLSLANGWIYLLIGGKFAHHDFKKTILRLFMFSTLLVLIFVPAYLYFKHPKAPYGVLFFGDSVIEIIAQGLEWSISPWGFFLLFSSIVGLVSLTQFDHVLLSVILGSALTIPVIIAADWVSGYWFASRQIFHLLPISMALAGLGISAMLDKLSALIAVQVRWVRSSLVLVPALLVLTILSVPRLIEYYDWNKSSARDITYSLTKVYDSGACVLIVPGWEDVIYRLYLIKVFNREDIANRLVPIVSDIESSFAKCDSAIPPFLVISDKYIKDYQAQLRNWGFIRITPAGNDTYVHFLFQGRERSTEETRHY